MRYLHVDKNFSLRAEVKSAGWSKYNSNELQVGGRCVIEITVNDLEQFSKSNEEDCSNNKLLNCSISDNNNKNLQQQLKQGFIRLYGYIQEISTDNKPVLVFIEDLGEKKLVPYSALKPFTITKRNKQKPWTPVNRNHANSDSSQFFFLFYSQLFPFDIYYPCATELQLCHSIRSALEKSIRLISTQEERLFECNGKQQK